MSHDALILGLLFQSALRALLLGAGVFAALKLARLRDPGAETAIWTMVLAGALAMPLLSLGLAGHILLTVPALAPASHASNGISARAPAPTHLFVAAAWVAYGVVALVGVARLLIGLVLTLRLYLAAEPAPEPWAEGRPVRFSPAISGPFSLAGAILLPADYRSWPEARRLAVMAHEEAHIRRGDFYILILAALHRALFWFNPFAWWLEWKLRELAERASDRAAIERIQDAPGYAEILLETARGARRLPAVAAMANGPGVAWRIDHILQPGPEQRIGAPARFCALSAVTAAALTIAAVQAAVAQSGTPSAAWLGQAAERQAETGAAPFKSGNHSARRGPSKSAGARRPHAEASAAAPSPTVVQPPAAVSYNPRALIEDPDAAVLPALVAAGSGQAVLLPELSKTGRREP